MATTNSLPQELIDLIVQSIIDNRLTRYNLHLLRQLRTTNRALYWAAIRLQSRSVQYYLDRRLGKCYAHGRARAPSELISSPQGSNDRFTQSVTVAGLSHIQVRTKHTPTFGRLIRKAALYLAKLPVLRHLHLNLEPAFYGPYASKSWCAALAHAAQRALVLCPVGIETLSLKPFELIVLDLGAAEPHAPADPDPQSEIEVAEPGEVPHAKPDCYLTRAMPYLKDLSLQAGGTKTHTSSRRKAASCT
ncbi:hypothetical protein BDW74DRAFT_179280 [Aspergillus multicolor]|uniref:uncharacterized protein n=1 Tax=Aspergillus multicolor TaxID=41759 RepID=UPI003CCDAB69